MSDMLLSVCPQFQIIIAAKSCCVPCFSFSCHALAQSSRACRLRLQSVFRESDTLAQVTQCSGVQGVLMASPEAADCNRKRAAIRVATMLRSLMGTDTEGNMQSDMYKIFQTTLALPEAKQDFKDKIVALKTKLEGLGISAESVANPISVWAVRHTRGGG